MINKKVEAFTIIELTIVMLLSAIVIGITYFAFDLLSKRYAVFKKQNEVVYSVTLLDKLLEQDFFFSDSVNSEGEVLVVSKKDQKVYYRFGDTLIFREVNDVVDTFRFKINQSMFFMNGNAKVNDYSMIDQLILDIEVNKNTVSHIYKKQYPATVLMGRALKNN